MIRSKVFGCLVEIITKHLPVSLKKVYREAYHAFAQSPGQPDSLPFVFCGVNWDDSGYGFPAKNVIGMIEVTPVPQLLEQLQVYAKGDWIGFLAPELLTAKKEAANYRKVFGLNITEYYAKDFEDFKKGFLKLQGQVDMLLLDSDGGLYKDHADELKAFVEANTKIPLPRLMR